MKEIQNDTPAIHQEEASVAEKIAASSQVSGTDAGSERAGDRQVNGYINVFCEKN
jgi:hypothetical protein